MSAQTEVGVANDVRLVGRLGAEPTETVLPSGSVISQFRVVVDRPPGHESAQKVDALECTAWTSRVRRSARTWRKGDVVEVEGAIRRRFFATASGRGSRVEIEVSSGRLIRRGPNA